MPDLDAASCVLYNQQMSTLDRYPVKFLCYYEPMDKIWGWVLPPQKEKPHSPYSSAWREPQLCYAFWAVMNKSISINTHHYHNKGSMHGLERRKITNKYVEIPVETLLERWPNFGDQLEQAIIFHKLSEG